MKKILFLLPICFFLLLGCEKDEGDGIPVIDPLATPSVPILKAATNVTNHSFTAHWNASSNAQSYEIDIATDSYFNMMVATETTTKTDLGILNLNSNTRYHYRVRAINGDKVSANSSVSNTFTLPDPPKALDATNVTSSGFTVNWLWSGSITSYLLDVSTVPFPHDPSSNLPNYSGKVVVSNTHNVVGLNSGTTYYYALRASNGAYISAMSNSITVTTLN